MLTKELKKQTRVRLRNGYEAETISMAHQTTTLCEVFGLFTEMGSVYSHDIVEYQNENGKWDVISGYQPCQLKCRKNLIGF